MARISWSPRACDAECQLGVRNLARDHDPVARLISVRWQGRSGRDGQGFDGGEVGRVASIVFSTRVERERDLARPPWRPLEYASDDLITAHLSVDTTRTPIGFEGVLEAAPEQPLHLDPVALQGRDGDALAGGDQASLPSGRLALLHILGEGLRQQADPCFDLLELGSRIRRRGGVLGNFHVCFGRVCLVGLPNHPAHRLGDLFELEDGLELHLCGHLGSGFGARRRLRPCRCDPRGGRRSPRREHDPAGHGRSGRSGARSSRDGCDPRKDLDGLEQRRVVSDLSFEVLEQRLLVGRSTGLAGDEQRLERKLADAFEATAEVGGHRRHTALHFLGDRDRFLLDGVPIGALGREVGVEADSRERQHGQQQKRHDELCADAHRSGLRKFVCPEFQNPPVHRDASSPEHIRSSPKN